MNNIKEMLESRGVETEHRKIKLVRHTLKEEPDTMKNFVLASAKNFAEWQCIQGVDSLGKNLRGGEFVVSFCYLPKNGESNRALFAGVFCNESTEPAMLDIDWHLSPQLAQIYHCEKPRRERYFYELRREPRFSDLERRVIVEWGGTRSWVQNFDRNNPERVAEVLPVSRRIFDEGYGA